MTTQLDPAPSTENTSAPAEAPAPPKPTRRASTHRFRPAAWVCLALAALGATVYFFGIRPRLANSQELARASQQAGQTSVLVVQPTLAVMAPDLNLPGSIQAKQQTSIYSRVNGYLRDWKADIGDRVKADDLLADVDAPDVDANVRGAQAQLALSEANLALAKANTVRSQTLFNQKVVSPQEFDTVKAAEQVSQATRDRDAALLQSQQSTQVYEQIRAPFSGTITTRYVDVGALIAVGGAANVQKLFDLAQTDPVRVFASVPQANVAGLSPQTSVVVTVDEYPGQEFPGKISRDAGVFDPTSRSMTVEIDLPNPDGQLYPGMYAHLKFVVPNPTPVLVVADNAILTGAKGSHVVSVGAAHKIHFLPVTLGRDYGTKSEILTGLSSGDWVVQNPTDDLTEGRAVNPQPSPAPAATPAKGK